MLLQRAFRTMLFFLALGLLPRAESADIAIVISDSGGAYAEFVTSFQQFLGSSPWRVRWSGTAETLEPAAYRADLIIAVGAEATRLSLARSESRPVFATLLPRHAYERAISEKHGALRNVSAVYLDQPVSRMVAFARQILPERRQIGLLVAADTRSQVALVKHAATANGATLETAEVENENTLLPTLNSLLGRSDLLLALPDNTLYRRENIRALLLTSFRYQKPVIAFSPAFVTAGALGAVYSSPTQIAHQVADVVRATSGENISLPAPQGPIQFSIALNRNVAQAFGIPLPDEAAVQRALGTEKDTR